VAGACVALAIAFIVLVGQTVVVEVDVATGGVVMMFACADRSSNVVNAMHKRSGSRGTENSAGNQKAQGCQELAKSGHEAAE
jgi:hypothetical protein